MLLAGDIGGTKTNLAIFSSETGPRAPLAEATFPSARYAGLEGIVREFLSRTGLKVERASFGVAGPVVAGRIVLSNLSWVVEEAQLQQALNLSSGGAITIVAPGTGLGEAFLTWDGSHYRAHASEGGHADFAPVNPFEVGLLRYLEGRFGHVSYERVCSGRGLPNIYAYLKDSGHADEPAWLVEQLAAANDPTPAIANAALDGEKPCELCAATLGAFVSILGAKAGNLALKVLATGSVYLGGGIPPRILPALEQGRFMETFRRKGRMSDLMSRTPVHVILNPKVALLGAACHGLEW
jgi:glucokinase